MYVGLIGNKISLKCVSKNAGFDSSWVKINASCSPNLRATGLAHGHGSGYWTSVESILPNFTFPSHRHVPDRARTRKHGIPKS